MFSINELEELLSSIKARIEVGPKFNFIGEESLTENEKRILLEERTRLWRRDVIGFKKMILIKLEQKRRELPQ